METWQDGAIYEGDYVQGQKSGKGKFKWADGSYYEGEFANNNIEGTVFIFSIKKNNFRAPILGQTIVPSQAHGRKIRCMDPVYSHGKTAENTKEST